MAKLEPITVTLNMIIPKLTRVWADDWEALYIDGVLKADGHSLSPRDIFEALGLECKELEAAKDEDGYTFVFTKKLEDMKVVTS